MNYDPNNQKQTHFTTNTKSKSINLVPMTNMSQNSSHSKVNCSQATKNANVKNLANLRDVLKATHQMRIKNCKNNRNMLINPNEFSTHIEDLINQQQQQQQRNQCRSHEKNDVNNLKSIIESFKLSDTNEINKKPSSALSSPSASTCSSSTVSSTQKFLINDSNNKLNDCLIKINKKYLKIKEETSDMTAGLDMINQDDEYSNLLNEESCKMETNFNRHDLIRRNISMKSDNKAYQAKLLNMNKGHQANDVRYKRNSCEQTVSSNKANESDKLKVKQSSSFNSNVIDDCFANDTSHLFGLLDQNSNGNSNGPNSQSTSSASSVSPNSLTTYWKYDELNDLRMKFISLLSAESSDANNKIMNKNNLVNFNDQLNLVDKQQSQQIEDFVPSSVSNTPMSKTLSHYSSSSKLDKQLSHEDQLKVESFYRSYGTSLFVSTTAASLYTINNAKVISAMNEANGEANQQLSQSTAQQALSNDLIHLIIKDIINNNHKKHISVYHCGIPLWLFNTGINPRRPNRQLKFTLAERGTGFILWQDRIDTNSNFKIYSIEKIDEDDMNIKVLSENDFSEVNVVENDTKSYLITFKASDKKTTVFIKFDLTQESVNFFKHYIETVKKLPCSYDSIKNRAKSLPAGVTGISSGSALFAKNTNPSISNSAANFKKYDVANKSNKTPTTTSRVSKNKSFQLNSSTYRNKRKSCIVNLNTTNYNNSLSSNIKLVNKRIQKNTISHPKNPRHIICIKSKDRDLYYTLSKLLPSNDLGVSKNKSLTPSPTYSMLSGCSTSPSSAAANTSQLTSDSLAVDDFNCKEKSGSCNEEAKRNSSSFMNVKSSTPQAEQTQSDLLIMYSEAYSNPQHMSQKLLQTQQYDLATSSTSSTSSFSSSSLSSAPYVAPAIVKIKTDNTDKLVNIKENTRRNDSATAHSALIKNNKKTIK